MRYFIRQLVLNFGIDLQISRATSVDEIKVLLEKLYPLKIDKELIRVGSKKDGGYLVPDDFEDIEALFSPGVGNKQDFDLELAKKGIKIFMADASVEGPKINHNNFNFVKKFLGSIDNDLYISMEKWINENFLKDNKDLILQMDIEGSEYEVIYSIPKNILERFRIIIIEFHNLDLLWNRKFFYKCKNVFLKLLETHYVVHNHPNNCCPTLRKGNIEIPPVLEMTFYRKDRANVIGYVNEFPHKLDVECTAEKPLLLPKCWYKN